MPNTKPFNSNLTPSEFLLSFPLFIFLNPLYYSRVIRLLLTSQYLYLLFNQLIYLSNVTYFPTPATSSIHPFLFLFLNSFNSEFFRNAIICNLREDCTNTLWNLMRVTDNNTAIVWEFL